MSAQAQAPQPGAFIASKYRVERSIGSGGMGEVFEVTHRVTGRRFAIKWLLPSVAKDDAAVRRFVREAQVAGRFEHDNVVEIYDIGQDAGSFYIVMELLQGESLLERLRRTGALDWSAACEILLPCVYGVAAAHRAGVIHRDLKPANVFLCASASRRLRPKVLDFGISKLVARDVATDITTTQPGMIMGTPLYMAPEQMRGQPADGRIDVYAFGVMFYECLAGRPPFIGNTYADLVMAVLSEDVSSLDEVVPNLPDGLAAVIARAMEREPSQRYASLEELAVALEPYAKHPARARQDVQSIVLARVPVTSPGSFSASASESLRAVERAVSERAARHPYARWAALGAAAATFALALRLGLAEDSDAERDRASAAQPPAASILRPAPAPGALEVPHVNPLRLEPELPAPVRVWAPPDAVAPSMASNPAEAAPASQAPPAARGAKPTQRAPAPTAKERAVSRIVRAEPPPAVAAPRASASSPARAPAATSGPTRATTTRARPRGPAAPGPERRPAQRAPEPRDLLRDDQLLDPFAER